MVVGTDVGTLADVIFAIEGTAINGAYLNDIKTNYIIPTLEYFSQGSLEDREYVCDESTSALYGIVVYHAADRLPSPCTDIYGPYSNPQRFLQMLDKLELVGGRGESHANVAEALATSLVCFDDMQLRRESGLSPQKHCILICNSPPYLMPVAENQTYAGNTAEQLATLFSERNIHLTILSPRKIPAMFKLYEKAGGDLSSVQTKNYAKDPRHLVLLKGFSLKERAVSPGGGGQGATPHLPVSMPSPLPPGGGTSPASAAGSVRYPVYGQGPAQAGPRQPGRWPLIAQRPQFPQPSSALIEQLTRPPTGISPQFNNTGAMGAGQTAVPLRNSGNMIGGAQSGQGMMAAGGGTGMMGGAPGTPAAGPMIGGSQGPNQGMLGAAQPGPTPGMMPPVPSQILPPQQQPPPQQANPIPTQQPQGLIGQQPGILGQGQPGQAGIIGQQQPGSQTIMAQQPPQQVTRERITIWQGVLEWIDKAKSSNEPQKLTRHVPCQVSATSKDGEPELKADSWPQKLIMQLMPKQLIGNIGGAYLKNSKTVLFHPQPCEALDALTKVMSTGFAGCVHFSSVPPCDIKVLILLYTPDKRAYLGFIPNDQGAFVQRLRKVIQEQKNTQALMRQQGGTQGGSSTAPGIGQTQPQIPGLIQQPAQQSQQSLVGGGMGGAGATGGGMLGGANMQGGSGGMQAGGLQGALQSGPAAMQGPLPSVQDPNAGAQQPPSSQGSGAAGSTGFNEVARQENLVKIQRLRQTLEAAQQQELQYKQLESRDQSGSLMFDGAADQNNFYGDQWQQQDWNAWPKANNVNILQFMNQIKMQQMQDPSQMNQQQSQLEEQQKLRAQLQQMQQQQQQGGPRMMRPAMPNNPGLRHLLQQPQYRLQMQQQMRPGAGGMPSNQQQAQQQQQQQFDDAYDFLS